MKSFLDTNVLVYAIDPRDLGKRERIRTRLAEWEGDRNIVISTQILLELHSVLTSKLRMAPAQSRAIVQATSLRYEVVALTTDLILHALDVHIIHQISHWDACVVVAAAATGCHDLITEDLQDGAVIEGVRIRNPFT